MGSPRVGSNPTGVVFAHRRSLRLSNFKEVSHGRAGPRLSGRAQQSLIAQQSPCLHKMGKSTHGLVAMTSVSQAEGRQFDPGWVYCNMQLSLRVRELVKDVAEYTQPGSSWRPSVCWADVIATRPWVLMRVSNTTTRSPLANLIKG